MEEPASTLLRPFKWLIGITEPTIRTPTVQVLRIPPDGSPPQIVKLHTVEVDSERNIDAFFVHIPDFRVYWGRGQGFRWRDIAGRTFRNQPVKKFNGVYVGWKSFDLEHLPLSKQTGFCGDAFIAKLPLWENDANGGNAFNAELPPWETDENGAVYEDISYAFVESDLYPEMVEALQRDHKEIFEPMWPATPYNPRGYY